MRTVSIRLEDLAKMTVKIGFVGENEHTRVCIDCKKAFEEYPNAAAALTVQPPAGEAYPDVTTRDGDTVIWDVMDHDLTDEGEGEFQLSFVVDETVMKSYIGRMAVCRSIVPAGDVPAAIDDWLTRANAALAEIPIEIAEALEEAKESGEFDGRGISDAVLNSDYTLTLYFTDGTSYTTPSIRGENGEDGQDGFSPTASVSKSGNTATITITDKTGTTTAQVTDGEDGQDGFSPTASVSKSGNTATITITDKTGTTTAQVTDGEDGETGATPVISIGTVSTLTPGSDATASMDTTDPEHPVLSLGIPEGEPGEVTEAELQAVADAKADVITESITTPAAMQTITDGADNLPMEIVVEIVAYQSGTGEPSPSNIRPITGRTSLVLNHTNQNLYGGDMWFGRGGTDDKTNRTTSGVNSSNLPAFIGIKYKPNTRYSFVFTAKTDGTNDYFGYRIDYTDGTNTQWSDSGLDSTKKTFIKYSASNKTISGIVRISKSGTKTFYVDECGVFEGIITADQFIAETGGTNTITFPDPPETVYGGTLKVNKDGTGVLTVTDANIASYAGETIPSTWISDRDVYAEGTTPTTGAQVVYKLADPVEYELTASQVGQIKSLYGMNNVWTNLSNSNILSVEYSADTKTYIDSANETQDDADTAIKAMIADSDSVVATESHAEGDVFICGNNLYRATAAIASGETITVGTNVEVLNLADYIKEVITSVGTVASDVSTLQTNVGALQAFGTDPDMVMTKNAYIWNADEFSFSGRKLTITNGVINIYYTSGGANTRGIWITNTMEGSSVASSSAVPTVNQLEPIGKINGANCLRCQCVATDNSHNVRLTLYYCSYDSDTGTITVLNSFDISAKSGDTATALTVPSEATHYAMSLYTPDKAAFNWTLYPKFMCLPTTT